MRDHPSEDLLNPRLIWDSTAKGKRELTGLGSQLV